MAYTPEYRVLRAAKRVGEKFPYYSPAAARLRFKRDSKNVSTMQIDCNLVVSYNASHVRKLKEEELEKIVLHEIMHYINGHHERYMNSTLRKTLPHVVHNIAMDIEINEFIEELPKDGFKAKNFGLPPGKSYEEYLGLINRDMPPDLKKYIDNLSICQNCTNGCNNPKNNKDKEEDEKEKQDGEGEEEESSDPCDGCPHQGNGLPFDDLNIDEYNGIYTTVLVDLINECEKNRGTEGDADDTIRTIPKRKYSWEQVFQNIVATKVTEIVAGFKYRTFEKINRRYVHTPDIILPQYFDRNSKIEIAIIMDISGSMGDNVNKMYGVMKSMIDVLDLKIEITVLEVNVCVENIMHGFDLNREYIESKDGGGTDMGAGLYYIEEYKIEADLIVVMTDSETPWPNPPILADKTVVLTDNPDTYDGPYPMYPVVF